MNLGSQRSHLRSRLNDNALHCLATQKLISRGKSLQLPFFICSESRRHKKHHRSRRNRSVSCEKRVASLHAAKDRHARSHSGLSDDDRHLSNENGDDVVHLIDEGEDVGQHQELNQEHALS